MNFRFENLWVLLSVHRAGIPWGILLSWQDHKMPHLPSEVFFEYLPPLEKVQSLAATYIAYD